MTITVLDGVTGSDSFNVLDYLSNLTTDDRSPRMLYCTKNSKMKALNFMTTDETETSVIVKEDRNIEVVVLGSSSAWKTCGSNKCLKISLEHILENMVITYVMTGGALLTVDLICN